MRRKRAITLYVLFLLATVLAGGPAPAPKGAAAPSPHQRPVTTTPWARGPATPWQTGFFAS